MIGLLNSLKILSSVSAIKILNNTIYVFGSNNVLTTFKLDNFSMLKSITLLKSDEHNHMYSKSYAMSDNRDIYTARNSNGYIFSQKDNKLIKDDSLKFHDGSVSVSVFSNNSKLLAIGDEDGKVFFYSLDINQLFFSFAPMSDAISCISFSNDDKFVSIASYDKSIIIYNLSTNKKLLNVCVNSVVEDILFIDGGMSIVGVTRDKELFTYNLLTGELIYGDFKFSEWPTTIVKVTQNNIVVGSRGHNIYLVNLNNLEITKEIEMSNTGVKILQIDNSNLYVGYVDGVVDIIDMDYKLKEFEINLNINKFKEATSLIQNNIFLLTHKIADKYETEWSNVLQSAKNLLSEQKIDEALELVEPFFFDKKKEEQYRFLTANKKTFVHFDKLIKDDKVMLALMFCDVHEYLKNTKEYLILEKKWQVIYQKCRLMFAKNDIQLSLKATSILQRYSSVSSKEEEISDLTQNHMFYTRAHMLAKERKFKQYFTLVQNKPFLKKEDIYEKILQLGNLTYLKLIDLEQKEEYEKASKIATYLLDFDTFKERASNHLTLISAKSQLIQSISNDDTMAIYDNVLQNSELENFKVFISYHKEFTTQKDIALSHAKDVNYDSLSVALDKYIEVDYLASNIALIFKIFYLGELQNFVESSFGTIKWEESINNYIAIYGLDNEIYSFMQKFDLEKSLTNLTIDNEEKSFENVEYLESILICK